MEDILMFSGQTMKLMEKKTQKHEIKKRHF